MLIKSGGEFGMNFVHIQKGYSTRKHKVFGVEGEKRLLSFLLIEGNVALTDVEILQIKGRIRAYIQAK